MELRLWTKGSDVERKTASDFLSLKLKWTYYAEALICELVDKSHLTLAL